MLLLGLLLFAASGAFAGLLIADNLGGGPETGVTVLNNNIGTVNTLGAFLAGIALTLMACAGIALMAGGLRWHRRRRVAADQPVAVDRTADPSLRTGASTDPTVTAPTTTADPAGTAQRPRSRPRHRFTH
ncbi:hypothetical protein [Kitasatospora cheerisanensis]|uniref:Uncharacterized protein n=1 Tax=Kitasatospora cheerisanensis KCTC 2395 TaxID=1348663 RepID=A0A066Z5N4_9ACTN|nr:hypothetical protein [Kitasatospora cheerisanensis]KDN87564.1 hypothetical protein KCH_06740 [Kitasatospora cheerisanensis KCTC 2395]